MSKIDVSCQICKKESEIKMEKSPFSGDWYHPWRRFDRYGIFFGLKCSPCFKKYPPSF
jgi:hypothetical protein